MWRLVPCSLLLAAACGGKKPAPASPAPSNTAQAQPDMHVMMARMDAEMANLPPAVHTFHDAFAPRWHAPAGAERTKATCVTLPELQADAAAIAAAAPPRATDPQAWTASTKQLTGALGALDAACKAGDATAFEAAFGTVHDAFHAVLSAAGLHMDMGHDGMRRQQAALERDLLEAEHDRAELTDEHAPALRASIDDGDGDGVGK